MLALPGVIRAEDAEPLFSGRFLVAVQGSHLPAATATDATLTALAGEGASVTHLLDATVPGANASPAGADGATPATITRRWLVLRLPLSVQTLAADPRSPRSPWDLAHQMVDGQVGGFGLLASLASGEAAGGVQLFAVEPDLRYSNPALERAYAAQAAAASKACVSHTAGTEVTICAQPSIHWPSPRRFAWHLESGYSELNDARREVAAEFADPLRRVRLVHADTGYNDGNVTTPAPNFDAAASLDFKIAGGPKPPAIDPGTQCSLCQPGHGTGTLSLLAGSRIQVRGSNGAIEFDDNLGGAPLASVTTYRLGNSVIHFYPVEMASAIAKATEQADVLSLSMGGLPLGALRDAVNEAYEHGLAIFAASGDFIQPPLLGVGTPKSVVYPARFERVVAVCGATADKLTYARAPRAWSWLHGDRASWMLRGSYGPPSVMTHALAAYTPNTPWSHYAKTAPSNLLDLDGAGTSASTPQVAAAAVLWLQKNRSTLEPKWRTWEKAEAVYSALLASADDGGPDPARKAYSKEYFGRGLLRAQHALHAPTKPLQHRPPADIGFGWLELLESGLGPFNAATAARHRVHEEMFRTEIAQLVTGSVKLQKLLGDRSFDQPIEAGLWRRVLRQVTKEPSCSQSLKRAIEAKLVTTT